MEGSYEVGASVSGSYVPGTITFTKIDEKTVKMEITSSSMGGITAEIETIALSGNENTVTIDYSGDLLYTLSGKQMEPPRSPSAEPYSRAFLRE